ncbi:MAG: TolC family protein [Alphaproteobacteria bacterium]|nr:TolC family protein [Alphaproteobacteria bacterium]
MFASAAVALASPAANALELPSIGDPFATQKKIAPYGTELKPAHCPEAPDTSKPLALNDVVIATICHNPDSRAAYLSLLSSADNYDVTITSFLPDVTASATGSDTSVRTEGSKSGISKSSSLSASAGMVLYDFGRREATLDIAERTLVAAGLSYDSTLQGFIASSLQGYFQVLTAQNSLKIAEETLELAKATLDASQIRYELGLVPLSDSLQAQTNYTQSELNLQQADNTLALARASLAQLMGFAPLTDLTVDELSDATLLVAPFDKELPALIEKAKAQRVDLQSRRLQLENAKDSLENTKRRALPTISANAGSSFSDWDVLNNDNLRTDSIGVSVTVPIFTGFSNIFSERSQRKQLEAQELQLTQSERNVEQDVLRSWQNYSTARKSFETSKASLSVARQLKDVTLGRYKEGLGSILDVLNALVSYRNSLQNNLTSRFNLLSTRVDLVRAVGELDLNTVEPETADFPPLANVVVYQDPLLKKEPAHENP